MRRRAVIVVVESLLDRPILSVNEARALTGTTYPAANGLVWRIADAGVLEEMTG